MTSVREITIVGVGALGSHVLPLLRNLGTELWAIDFDRVEQKNLSAQFYAKNTVGRGKAVALSQMMDFLWGKVVKVFPHKLTEDNVLQLLGDDDHNLIVDCLDNGASRRVVQRHIQDMAMPCIHGALAADGTYGRVVWDRDFIIDDEAPGAATCEGGEHLPFISTVASMLAHAVQAYVKTGKHVGYSISPGGIITI
jgi:molybdopterin/thiamine biosynthesis adenylyltransferase